MEEDSFPHQIPIRSRYILQRSGCNRLKRIIKCKLWNRRQKSEWRLCTSIGLGINVSWGDRDALKRDIMELNSRLGTRFYWVAVGRLHDSRHCNTPHTKIDNLNIRRSKTIFRV